MILVCNTLMLFFLLLAFPVVLPLVLTSKKRKKTILQRLGFGGLLKKAIPQGKLAREDQPIWIHALSVGETFSSVELVKAVRQKLPGRKLFFSVSTATGFDEAQKRLVHHTDHIFFYPYDFIFVVRKVIERISPSLFVLVESDIWPTFLLELKKKNVPAILVNARLSSSSFVGYQKLSLIMAPVLNTFIKICVQSDRQGGRFLKLGVRRDKIYVTGNLKFDQKPNPVSEEQINFMKNEMAVSEKSPVFMAGSTHPGEEKILLQVLRKLKILFPQLVLILVPRDPERADEINRLAMAMNFSVVKMSQAGSEISDVVVVDRMGILGKLYAIADIAFVGGSLVDFGGHNPLEPAAFAKPVLFGSYVSDFPEISAMLLEAGGAIQVKNQEDLYRLVRHLLMNPADAKKIGEKAFQVFRVNHGAVEKTATLIKHIDEKFHDH